MDYLIVLVLAYNILLFLFVDTLNLYTFVGAQSLIFEKIPTLETLRNFMFINLIIILASLISSNLYVLYLLRPGMDVTQIIFITMLLFFEVQVILYPLLLKKLKVCNTWLEAFLLGFLTPTISIFSIYLYTQIICNSVGAGDIIPLTLLLFSINLFIGYGVISLFNIVVGYKCFRCKRVFIYSSIVLSTLTVFLIWSMKHNKIVDLLLICICGAGIPYLTLLEDRIPKEEIFYISLGIFAVLISLAMYAVSAKLIIDTIASYSLYKILHIF